MGFEPKVIPALLDAGFRNAYAGCPSFTAWCGFLDRDIKATFDYIFTRGAIEARSVLELPSEEYVAQFPARLPNEICPSDHFCLAADLELCATGQSNVEMATPRALELSDAELDTRLSESPSGALDFFVECRFTEPSLCRGISDIQGVLRGVDPNIIVEQSCAPDNLHITMNEFRLSKIADVHRVAALLEACLLQDSSSTPLALQGIAVLGGRVLYADLVKNDGAGRLCQSFDLMQRALRDAGFKPRDRGQFVPHVTVGKARSGHVSGPVLNSLCEHGFDQVQLGTQPFAELCFCCKRRPSEAVPPVVRRLSVG